MNGQLAVSRAFGDKSLKSHLRSDPDIRDINIDANMDILILASDGLWKVNISFHSLLSVALKPTHFQLQRIKTKRAKTFLSLQSCSCIYICSSYECE